MRQFTFETDRLISLDGLAREVSKAPNNSCKMAEYFYGTWLRDLPEYILWASYRWGDRRTAWPSWSWASCASSVWLRFRDFDNMRPDELMMCDCEVLGVDEDTGVLTVSTIRIDITHWDFSLMEKVPLHELRNEKGRLAYRQPLVQGYSVGSADTQLAGWIEFDDERDALEITQPIFYMHLGKATYYTEPKVQYWGILLERHPTRNGAFKRVGMGSLYDSDFLKGLERQETAIA